MFIQINLVLIICSLIYIGVEGNPAPNMRANVNFNILGNVAENPIDEIFYENRGRPESVNTDRRTDSNY